jgi:hypothetical protein
MMHDADGEAFNDEAEGEVIPRPPSFWTVAVYLREQAYGGPEEGGWWFDTGVRIDDPTEHGLINVPSVFFDREAARTFAIECQDFVG